MPATRSSTKPRRETQTSRQNAMRQDRRDYHKCDTCGGLFSRYRNSHKRHIRVCEARSQDLRAEGARVLAERYTPTPEPYIRVSSSAEMEVELGVRFDSDMAGDHGALAFVLCCLHPNNL